MSLLIYRNLLSLEPGRSGLRLLSVLTQSDVDLAVVLEAYGQWFSAAAATAGWQVWIEQQVATAENALTQRLQHQNLDDISADLVNAACHDLDILQRWAVEGPRLVQTALRDKTGFDLPIPGQRAHINATNSSMGNVSFDFSGFSAWSEALPALAQHYRQNGAGLFSQYSALRWRDRALEGIAHPDLIDMADLVGYSHQQAVLKQNTEALLSGYPALNVLLYGSRGSGKSALVKALLSDYRDRGLRLIELSKADMVHLPQVVESLRTSSLKFVIFVDDLSFEKDEESYKALKVVLEGTLTARPKNVVVYATSNRRHLIREFFNDRPRPSDADEVHNWDTVQEKLSLSDRFGLTLTFEPANQETYLEIVRGYAQRYGLKIPDAELTQRALQWTVQHNVRSGRTARQFIDHLRSQPLRSGNSSVQDEANL